MTNLRAYTVVESLLDITEDLNSRMALFRSQYPEFDENAIREMNAADPTGDNAKYMPWLLRMRKKYLDGQGDGWDGSIEHIKTSLERYDAVKNAADFTGEKNIGNIGSVQALDEILAANMHAGTKSQKAASGARLLNTVGVYKLFNATTHEALRKFAIGYGTIDKLEAKWCTHGETHASNYLSSGRIYVVTKSGHPYVQFYISKDLSRTEAKDTSDKEINAHIAIEIAPVCDAPELKSVWDSIVPSKSDFVVTDTSIERQLNIIAQRWVSEKTQGYQSRNTNKWVDAVCESSEEALAMLRERLFDGVNPATGKARKGFYNFWRESVENNDQEIIKMIGQQQSSKTGGVQLISNAVHMLRSNGKVNMLPESLQSPEAFTALFNKVIQKIK